MSQKELLIVNSVENVSLYHAITGSRISNQKCPPGKIGVCYCKKRNLLIRKENKKTVIKILKPFKNLQEKKVNVSDKLSVVEFSKSGIWLAGGDNNGNLYIWQTDIGALHFKSAFHYDRITKICFSIDDSLLFVSSKDASISVWKVSECVNVKENWIKNEKINEPILVIREAIASLSDFQCGFGDYPRLFMLYSDGILKIPSAGDCLIVDPSERFLAATGKSSSVYLLRTNLSGGDMDLENGQHALSEIMGNKSVNNNMSSKMLKLEGCSHSITSLAFNIGASLIIGGCSSGEVYIWDVSSRQIINSFFPAKNPIIHLEFVLRSEIDLQSIKNEQEDKSHHRKGLLPPVKIYNSTVKETDNTFLEEKKNDNIVASKPIQAKDEYYSSESELEQIKRCFGRSFPFFQE